MSHASSEVTTSVAAIATGVTLSPVSMGKWITNGSAQAERHAGDRIMGPFPWTDPIAIRGAQLKPLEDRKRIATRCLPVRNAGGRVSWITKLEIQRSETNVDETSGALVPLLRSLQTLLTSVNAVTMAIQCHKVVIYAPTLNSRYSSLFPVPVESNNVNPRPTGGGAISSPPSGILAISSKPMQISPPYLQYPLSQHFYSIVLKF